LPRCGPVRAGSIFSFKQVCVQRRCSAVNTALSAFAAERRAAAQLLLSAGTSYRSISPARTAPQRTCRTPLLLSMDRTDRRTDRRTDGWTLDRFVNPVPHAMRAL